ncbi:Protein of unknown function [Stigmatella aurantiaca]|uniref:DUF3396 domain-containing protein n=1 Tax=Stigmatella aurantiaca TaxID=41 RepID=A0A1H8D334_STIAU|nr:DUF3396 domain-containing protein [Stigmatella aurantiaca]SEN01710.1 Protein of unknown function [Stigmatella aurantiaca]
MSSHYPKIRVLAQNGELLIREGLDICFYINRPHQEIAQAVMHSLETYITLTGPQALTWYVDMNGDMQALDSKNWDRIQTELLTGRGAYLCLRDGPGGIGEFQFEYRGKPPTKTSSADWDRPVCVASFWLSTEFLEKHGPAQVRELALAIAQPLPFNSGHAGLSFNAFLDLIGVSGEIRRWCFRYPGLDITHLDCLSSELGTRIKGVHWLTFLGQPVLDELGGATGLRGLLKSPSTEVQPLDSARVVITLGQSPEAGDIDQGNTLPQYRELARMLEPWLYQHRLCFSDFTEAETRRWERRFLD